MKIDWRYPFDDNGLNYLSAKAKQINDVAALLGVPVPGLAGGIAREMTLQRREYPKDRLWVAGQPVKALLTSTELDEPGRDPMGPDTPLLPWKPITHGTIAEHFARSNILPRGTLGNPTYTDRLANPIFFDVGPGNIKIRTAISMLQNYNQLFPYSDPIDLKRYNDRYDLLVHDLKNPDSDTTIKIAGLVAREGQDFYRKTMTPERWAALSEDEQAAALTKYYAVGKERMEDDYLKQGGVARTYTPDFNGDGSDMYLYDPGDGTAPNPARLKEALSPPVQKQDKLEMPPGRRADAGPGANSVSPGQEATAQPAAGSPVPVQAGSPVPPQVIATGHYLRANGYEITPRTMYVSHVLGPERAVDLFRRTGSSGSPPEVPSPDAATGEQMRAWVRALRGAAGMAPGGGIASPAPASPALATDASAEARDVANNSFA